MNTLKELRNFKQNLRNLKADNLRSMRYYERENGKTDFGYYSSIANFMCGMARGKTAPLKTLDNIIKRLEMEEEDGDC